MDKLKVLSINKQPSKYGGEFYYIFFKNIDTGSSLKTCVADSYRNYKNWKNIIEKFNNNEEVIITNVRINTSLVDADSLPEIVEVSA